MADVVLSAKMSDSELLKSIDDTLGKAQTKFDNFTKGINTNLGKVNSIPNGALGVNEFKQATDALESYRKKQDDISKAWADFEGKNSRIADAQARIVGQKEKERLAQEKINELREKEINAAWQQKDSQDANIRIKSEQQLQKEIEQGQKAVQQRQRESDRASEKERSNILSQIDKEKELARIQDERKRQTSILESLKTGNINLGDESYRLGDLKEMRDIAASYRNSLTEGSSELNKMNGIYQQLVLKIKDAENTERSKAILMEKQNLETAKSMPETNIAESENKLKRLLELKQRVESQNLFNEKEINSVNNAITRVNKNIEKLKLTSAKTTSMSDIFGMSEKTLNDVASKMKAISEYRMNFGAGSSQLSSLNKEYERLAEVQKKSLTQGIELEKGNSKLAASWENLFRRVAFYASLGAFTGFMKSMVSVRAEFEMTERSLGALLGSWEKGTDLFNKIQANALKSPFSILELSQSAKQLIAYNFAESEAVETTKRLADISSALGVSMERLVYNLGQIKAQGVLTARDARDFANAGLAIVPMLAKMYTEQKRFGNVAVTTANVYDMMTKKMVSYNDVMSVMNKITDEGGMFFDFQAKQAETLKGKLSNLGDAYDLMLNQMGQDNSGFINGTVSVITTLVRNWKSVEKALLGVVFAVGLYKSAAISAFIWSKMGIISSMATSFISLAKSIFIADASAKSFAITMKGIMMTNPFGVLLVAVTAFVGAMQLLNKESEDLSGNIKTFGDSAGATLNKVDTLYKTIKGTTEGSNTYKKAISELNTILDEYGIRNIREIDNLDEINKKRKQAIELIKTEGIERERANALEEASKQYTDKLSKAKTQLIRELQGAMTEGLLVSANDEIRKNAQPIASVVASIVNENIDLIANKQGKAYEDGMGKIFSKIQDSMRKMGLDEEVISKSWLTNTFGYHTNIIKNYLSPVKEAKEEYNNWTNNVENWANAAKRATDSTMTFKQKTDATNRALQKQTESVHDLYKNIKNLMSQYSDNNIGFTINVGGDVPEWMMGKKVSELERLAKLFASAGKNAKGGAKVNGVLYSQQDLLQRGADYVTAAEKKQLKIEQDLADKKKDRVDYQLQAIEKELQLIDKLRKGYDDLKKAGYSAEDAKGILAEQFAQNIKTVNSMLNKFGIAPINMARVAGASDTAIKKLLESQMGKLSSVAAKDKASLTIGELSFNAAKINITEINKELQDTFNEIKSSFELGIEIEENPEIGKILQGMFMINEDDIITSTDNVIKKLQERWNKYVEDYNKLNKESKIKQTEIIVTKPTTFIKENNVDPTGEVAKNYKMFYDAIYGYAKNDAEKTLKEYNDLNYKLTDNSGKIIIEERKLEDLRVKLAKETNEKRKSLLNLQIIDQQNTIDKIKEENLQLLPFYQKLFGDTYNLSSKTLQKIADDAKSITDTAKEVTENGVTKIELSLTDEGGNIKKTVVSLEQYRKILKATADINQKNIEKNPFKQITDDIKKGNTVELLNVLSEELKKISEGIALIGSIFKDLGASDDAVETINDVAQSIDGLSTAAQGAAQLVAGDIIGGTVNIIKGTWTAISGWLDNSNKKIDRKIKDSEFTVKKLANAYTQLEYAANKALGSAEIKAQRLLVANKKAQLEEAKRQLALEESRKKKNRDKNKEEDLKAEIANLENDINDLADNVANTLLNGDIKSAAESFASTWIEAWREGNDTIANMNSSFEDMIDNMIVKSLASTLVANRLKNIYSMVDKFTQDKSEGGVALVRNEILKIQEATKGLAEGINADLTTLVQSFGIGKGSSKTSSTLSSLQQGIQGLSEQTGGAIEGYMNNVSQQSFAQTSLLQQLADNSNVSLGTQSQMLLQLQQGYQVLLAMQSMLQGWSSNTGRSVRVEMIN